MKKQTGSIVLPVLIAVAIIGGAVITFGVLKHNQPVIDLTESKEEGAKGATATNNRPRLVWSSFGLNSISGQVSSGMAAYQTISVGPAPHVKIEVTSEAGAKVELKDPTGKVIVKNSNVTIQTVTDPVTKKVTTTYDISHNTQAGDWQVAVTNPGDSSNQYTVTVPQATPPLVISPNVSQVVGTGQGIQVAISVEETTVQAVVPITGAHVVATVTDPNGDSTSIVLHEDPQNPGTYNGTYTGTTPGTYEIEYVIDGTNAAGDPFTQTTTGTFTVTADSGVTNTTNYYKKYDINRSNEIQLIGY